MNYTKLWYHNFMKRIEGRDKPSGSNLGGGEDNEERRRTSRRDLLRSTAIAGGGLAVVGVGGVFGAKALDKEKKDRYGTKPEGEGVITSVARILDKQYVPSKVVPHMMGKTTSLVRHDEKWQLVLSIEDHLTGEDEKDKREVVEVTKEQFDSIVVGDELTVSYRIRTLGPLKQRENIFLEEK